MQGRVRPRVPRARGRPERDVPATQRPIGGNSRKTTWHDDGTVTVEQHDPRETVAALLAAGADPDRPGRDGWTALMWAFYSPDLVRMLLPHVRDVDARTTSGRTALSLAAGNGATESIRLLLARGADVNAVDAEGKTPLDHVGHYHAETREVLLDAGARPSATR